MKCAKFGCLTVIASELVKVYEAIRRDIGEFLDACRGHKRRENSLAQDAYLVDVGTGDKGCLQNRGFGKELWSGGTGLFLAVV